MAYNGYYGIIGLIIIGYIIAMGSLIGDDYDHNYWG